MIPHTASIHSCPDPRGSVLRLPALLVVLLTLGSVTLAAPALARADTAEPTGEPGSGSASADPSAAAESEGPPPGPDTPRGAVGTYLDLCRAGDYAAAADYLDLRGLPAGEAKTGPKLARRLKVVLDQKLWVKTHELASTPEGDREDGFSGYTDRVGTIDTARGPVDILVERVGGAPGASPLWKISSITVARIPDLYEEFGHGLLGEVLPDAFFVVRFMELELWQWLGLLLLTFLAYLLSWLGAVGTQRAIMPLISRSETQLDDALMDAALRPARFGFALFFFWIALPLMRLSLPAVDLAGKLLQALAILAATWLLLRITDVLADQVRRSFEEDKQRSAVAVIPLGRKAVKVVLVLLAGLALLQNIGFNVTGLVAGLGVGGLAFALAAQKTIENLFGGVTLITDQPVRVGDFCKFGDKAGTVEDVGLRSTRVRTLDRTVITIPNAEFSQTQLENFAMRDRIKLQTTLGLRYETSADQLRFVLTELRRLLASHPKVADDVARVRFVSFGGSSLDLEIFTYIQTGDWSEYLAVKEDLYLRMIDIVADAGTGFAFPSQTIYQMPDEGIDAAKTKKAEAAVAGWRKEGRLPFPDIDPAEIERINDSLDYPPTGSVSASTSS